MAELEEKKNEKPEGRQKVKVIKNARPAEVKLQKGDAFQGSSQPTQPEKKKVVLVKKKQVVSVKSSPADTSGHSSEVRAEESKASTGSSSASAAGNTTGAATSREAGVDNGQSSASDASPSSKATTQTTSPASGGSFTKTSQGETRKPAQGSSEVKIDLSKEKILGQQIVRPTVQPKKVVKLSKATNSVINNGPVIISGANLPPISPFQGGHSSSYTGPKGLVAGVRYDKDGKILKARPRGGMERRPITGTYTPKGAQKGSFGQSGRGPGAGGFRPGFGGPGRGGFAPEPVSDNKKGRKGSKDKGRDYRRDHAEDEMELKQYGRKKSMEPQAVVSKSIEIMQSVTVGELARKMNIKASEIISKLFSMGEMVSINQSIDSDTASLIAAEYGCEVKIIDLYEETVIQTEADRVEDMMPRAPIVTVMGHVDHGKTRLLDTIRKSNVIAGEFGGITQHIGAYKVNIPGKRDVVFLDTPGHAAFTLMRARGAQITDIVVLVVAATDGVMPQTREAIDHAKAAGVPIIVAINKVDLPEAKPERVMQQLSELGLMPEEWGGSTLFCKISAKQNFGIFRPILEEENLPAEVRRRLEAEGDHSDGLLDTILLQADMMELQANPSVRAEGKVLEARIDQGRGIVASVMVQRGTLRQGDYYVAGIYAGRVRAMFDDRGQKVKEAGPSTPVEIIGLSDIPKAGDPIQVTEDEKTARSIGAKRQELERLNKASSFKKVTLDNMFDVMHEGEMKELCLVIKGDVQGSVEALQMALEKLSTDEVRVRVIRSAAGAIIEDDVNLASASENPAIIVAFNVRPTPKAQQRADEEKIEIRKYNVIYDVVDDIKAAMEGMLSPEKKEIDVGSAQVRQVFKVPKVGLVAGCMVLSGSVKRTNFCRVVRDNIQMSRELLKIASLKRFKDDAREVSAGFECGIGLENYQDLKEGDIIEFVEIEETARHLSDTGVTL